ncbi:HPr family phosphocarrier protein [Alicyclobacillus fastidiosus]|uniref:Phosphocarrier protein HPr n=1 Tax=Alicyclobacillus fastidiosus TaxID=392011 RepID=A0ABV5AB96_9BACL|nr:HPr family phosphocarrier protein [Alicyclobacillus fastidiosus]WEH10566.1 HPr family phosphocarrier protein [Alicyclobacillus fastidiosus]
MKEATVQVHLEQGLHARPASLFVKKANTFSSEISVIKDGRKANGKSILGLMGLAAGHGSQVTIQADGVDEEQAIQELSEFLLLEHEVEI